MFSTFTMADLITNASTIATSLGTPLLIVSGIAVAFGVGNWIFAKVRGARSR